MDTMKDGVELINAKPVPKPGGGSARLSSRSSRRWPSTAHHWAYQWNVVPWLFSQSLRAGRGHDGDRHGAGDHDGDWRVSRSTRCCAGWQWPTHLFFRGNVIYTQLILWSLPPTLYPSLSFGVPFLGSMFGWEVASIRPPTSRRSGWRSCLGPNGAYLAEISVPAPLSVSNSGGGDLP